MKILSRFCASVVFLIAAACLNSSASVLCSNGPTGPISGNGTGWQTIYTCTLPANAVPTNQSVRVTAAIHGTGSSGGYLPGLRSTEL